MPRHAVALTKTTLDTMRKRAAARAALERAERTGSPEEAERARAALAALPLTTKEAEALKKAWELATDPAERRRIKAEIKRRGKPLPETAADADQPGLRAQERNGKLCFQFIYRPPSGGERRVLPIDVFGAITLDEARRAAGKLRAQVSVDRVDPREARAAEKREREATVGAAVAGYLADLEARAESGVAKRGRTSGHAAMAQLLQKHVVPALGAVPLRALTTERVRLLHKNLGATPGVANHVLGALSAVYGWAQRKELVPTGTNPTRHVERHREEGERRALTAAELGRLGAALRELDGSADPRALLGVRLLGLTGMRRAEVFGSTIRAARARGELGLRWSDVDLERGVVTLRVSKTGRQTRAIGAAAVELLRAARPAAVDPESTVCSFVGVDKIRRKLWTAARIESSPGVCVDLHSLRHSFASVGAHLQHGRFVGAVSALIGHGHQARSITQRYITENPEALRPAADAIAAEMARLLGMGEPATVLAFPAGGAR
jgi:integrase